MKIEKSEIGSRSERNGGGVEVEGRVRKGSGGWEIRKRRGWS